MTKHRMWKAIYVDVNTEDDAKVERLLARVKRAIPSLDWDQTWEWCEPDDDIDELDDLLRRCWNNLQGTSSVPR